MNTFFLIVLGQIISLFGNAALRFALPLYLLRQTGSAALYGGITALAMLPALAGMLTGGALADRCRKARLMALLDLVTAGISAAAAAGLPHLPLLPLILTVLGSLYAIQGLYQPVVRACLPLLLNGTQLLRGNAVIQLMDTVDELLGPLLGAVLLEHFGIRGLLALCGGCFAFSAGMELCLRIPQDVPSDTRLSVRSLCTDLRESARFLTGQAAVLQLAAAMAAVNLLEVPALTVGVPVLVVQTLQKSDASLGLVQAVLSAGGILGGVLAGTVFVRHPIRSGTGLLLALSGVCAARACVSAHGTVSAHSDGQDPGARGGCGDSLARTALLPCERPHRILRQRRHAKSGGGGRKERTAAARLPGQGELLRAPVQPS